MRQGFSLVELSIVLVILGLLTGGILAGQSLIRASELRAFTAEYNRYVTAAQTFRDKYFAIPGDMTNATKFWNRQVNQVDCVTNSSAAVGTPGACDGNGNGTINIAAAANQAGEVFGVWGHLSDAGLIEGSYTGLAGSSGQYHHVPGTNAPATKIGSALAWYANGVGVTAGSAGNFFAGDYGNTLLIINASTNAQYLKPEEAWNIDTKLDDGKPATGRIFAFNYASCTNGASVTDTAATYALTTTSIVCGLYFTKAF